MACAEPLRLRSHCSDDFRANFSWRSVVPPSTGDRGAVHVGSAVRREERDEVAHLLRRTEAAGRDRRRAWRGMMSLRRGKGLGRPDQPREHGVGGDAGGGELERHRLGEPDEPFLGGAVAGLLVRASATTCC